MSIIHTISGSERSLGSVKVIVKDNEGYSLRLSSYGDTLTGDGSRTTYEVSLNKEPTGPVRVAVTSSDPGAVTVSPASLTFTTGSTTNWNWNDPQTVTLTAKYDADEDDEVVSITHTPIGGGYDDSGTEQFTASVNDSGDVFPGITISQEGIVKMIPEGQKTTYTVVLNTKPARDVTVNISKTEHVSVEPTTLTFTPDTWDKFKTVTVTGESQQGRASSVHHATESADPNYNISLAGFAKFIVVPVPEVRITPTNLNITDYGFYQVSLSKPPEGTVAVGIKYRLNDIRISGDDIVAIEEQENGTFGIAYIYFDSDNFNKAKTVYVYGVGSSKNTSISHTLYQKDHEYKDKSLVKLSDKNFVSVTLNDLTLDSSTDSLKHSLKSIYQPLANEVLQVLEKKSIDSIDGNDVLLLRSLTQFEIRDVGNKYPWQLHEQDLMRISAYMPNLNGLYIMGNHQLKTINLAWQNPLEVVIINKNNVLEEVNVNQLTTNNLVISRLHAGDTPGDIIPANDITVWDVVKEAGMAVNPPSYLVPTLIKERRSTILGSISSRSEVGHGAGRGNENLRSISLTKNVTVRDNFTIGRSPKIVSIEYDTNASRVNNVTINTTNTKDFAIGIEIGGKEGTQLQTIMLPTVTNLYIRENILIRREYDPTKYYDKYRATITTTCETIGNNPSVFNKLVEEYEIVLYPSYCVVPDLESPSITERTNSIWEAGETYLDGLCDAANTVGGAKDAPKDTAAEQLIDSVMKNEIEPDSEDYEGYLHSLIEVFNSGKKIDDYRQCLGTLKELSVDIKKVFTGVGKSMTDDALKASTLIGKGLTKIGLSRVALKAVPGLGWASLAYDVADAVWSRIMNQRTGEYISYLWSEDMADDIADFLLAHGPALDSGDFDFQQVLIQSFSGKTFAFPLSLGENLQDVDLDQQDDSAPHRIKAGFRGGFDYSKYSDREDDSEVDGHSYSYVLGFDIQPTPLLDTGLSLVYNTTTADYESTDPIFIRTKATYNTRLTSVHPFVKWKATDTLDLYASVGYGRINTEVTINEVANPLFSFMEGESRESEGAYSSFSAGISYTAWQSEFTDLALKLDGTTSSFMDTAHSQQARLTAALSHDFVFEPGVLDTGLDLALLMSDSDPSVMELTGRLGWSPQDSRFSTSARARVLLFGGERKEWGFGGSFSYLHATDGEGLNIDLRPSIGRTSQRFGNHDDWFLTDTDVADLSFSNAPYGPQLGMGLGYGFRTGNALLTPYTDVFLTQAYSSYSLGLRYDVEDDLEVELETTHNRRSSGNSDNRIDLRLRSSF